MQIVDAIKNLTIAMKGSGSVEDITTDQIAGAIQYMADNWEAISAGIGGGGEAVSVDTLSGATDTGKSLMKAANQQTAREAIGAGTPYTLPTAKADSLGGVKLASAVNVVSAADATAAGEAYDQTVAQSTVTLANANKAAINAIITNLKTAGIMA